MYIPHVRKKVADLGKKRANYLPVVCLFPCSSYDFQGQVLPRGFHMQPYMGMEGQTAKLTVHLLSLILHE